MMNQTRAPWSTLLRRRLGRICAAGLGLALAGCGGGVSSTPSLPAPPAVTVSVSPAAVTLSVGATQQFAAAVANATNTAVTWSVDGVAGGNSTIGTISSSGLYTTPAGPGIHQVSAASQLDPAKTGQASATVAYAGVLMYHNDLARTGQNLNETTVTPSNVNSTQFGKLFSYPVDSNIYAQPLYVASVAIPGQGVHNVVYVATMNDSVYAFDADGKSSGPLWYTSFLKPGVTSVSAPAVFDTAFPGGEIGILGTPVIDPVGGTLYAVAYTTESGGYVYRLHALDLASGKEKFGGPVVIQATVAGNGVDNNGHNQVAFNALAHLQRPGLLFENGVVYVGFGSHADTPSWHGWLLGYNASTLRQTVAFNTTPNGSDGSLWAAGGAPAADSSGNIFFATGNGTFDAGSSGSDYGDSVLKLQSGLSGTLKILDWFAPFNTNFLCSTDLDLGSGGVVLLPDQPGAHPHLLVVAGKEGRIYLLDRDNLGHFNAASDTQVVQELVGAILPTNLSTPAYWQGNLYYASEYDTLRMFTLTNGLLSTSAVSVSPETLGYAGATPSISSNGPSGGIMWIIDTNASSYGAPAVLRAYDATNVSHELYNSNQAGPRDTPGQGVKFTVPIVVNGKVYAGTATELDVFGLLPK
ncbi:MAG TPA: hypothetical protein VGW33_09620 [Terriglobia bacterium]|nr:hypothetical protein [Terriglobia bacterium]